MKKSILALFCIALICSCTKSTGEKAENESLEAATPEVLLKENLGNYSRDLFSSDGYRGYDADIVSDLYKEALNKNAELDDLNKKLRRVKKHKNDSLKLYNRYSDINERYWKKSYTHIDQLSDTVLKKSTHEFFKNLEKDFALSISVHEAALDSISKRTLSLNDQLILLKLSVTQFMIKNYQLNEKPDLKPLEDIIREYDTLIDVTRGYIEQLK